MAHLVPGSFLRDKGQPASRSCVLLEINEQCTNHKNPCCHDHVNCGRLSYSSAELLKKVIHLLIRGLTMSSRLALSSGVYMTLLPQSLKNCNYRLRPPHLANIIIYCTPKGRKSHYAIHSKQRMCNKNKSHGAIRRHPHYSCVYPNDLTIVK